MRFQETQVIAVTNQKGGCGKTTTAVSLAAAFASLGYEACVVDIEPQCNATMTFKFDPDEVIRKGGCTVADIYLSATPAIEIRCIYEGKFDNRISVVPGNFQLPTVNAILGEQMYRAVFLEGADKGQIQQRDLFRLRESINSLRGVVDLVIIDTPPALEFITSSALIAADWLLVPVFPSGYDLSGLERFLNGVEAYRVNYNPKLRLAGILLGAVNKQTLQARGVYKLLTDAFGNRLVFRTIIGASVRLQEAAIHRVTIFEHDDGQKVIDQFTELAKELLARSASGAAVEPLPEADCMGRVGNG